MGKEEKSIVNQLKDMGSALKGDWGELTDFSIPKPSKEKIKTTTKGIFTGNILKTDFLKNNLPMMLTLFMFALFMIGHGYYCERQLRTINELEHKLEDARIQYLTFSSEYMESSKQSKIKEKIRQEQLRLEESTVPPYSLK